jgi:hypothetical protein
MDPQKLESDLTSRSLMVMILAVCVRKIMASSALVSSNFQIPFGSYLNSLFVAEDALFPQLNYCAQTFLLLKNLRG